MERVALERHGPADGRVSVMGIREDRIVWARLYMEPVEQAGQDIDEAMRTITGKDRGDEQ